ncbi:MAG: DUF2155 domain-containing protein [Gemmatimonadetes bacterium]|nr:MAG: DUF2155 domain-containing protein [Gemmatimonadota bacterium]
MSSGTHALLRALDKLKGESEELPMRVGETVRYGRLSITLQACRFPAENPASDALTFLEIRDAVDRELLFRGWMFASSPALNALDDRRYDVWPLRCTAETG